MEYMFSECSSLKELYINNFNIDKVVYMNYMFSGCSEELKMKIKNKIINIKEEAFEDIDLF